MEGSRFGSGGDEGEGGSGVDGCILWWGGVEFMMVLPSIVWIGESAYAMSERCGMYKYGMYGVL